MSHITYIVNAILEFILLRPPLAMETTQKNEKHIKSFDQKTQQL